MTLYEMLKEIVNKGKPLSDLGVCFYCQADVVMDGQEHRESCTWKLAEEYVSRKEDTSE